MYKTIVTAGCSYVQNSYTDKLRQTDEEIAQCRSNAQYYTSTFGHKLAQLLNAEFINLAKAGSSIEAIVWQVTQWLSYLPSNDSLLIIGITHTNRVNLSHPYQRYKLTPKFKDGLTPFCLGKPSNIENEYTEFFSDYLTKEEYTSFISTYWKYFADLERMTFNDVYRLVTLQAYLNKLQVPHIFIDITGHGDFITKGDNWGYYLDNIFQFNDNITAWKEYIHSYDKRYNNGHPIQSDHHLLGELLYKFLYSENFSQQFSQDR